MHVFYQPDVADTLTLSNEESKHAVNVLRMTNGDVIYVNDGVGNLFQAKIIESHPKKVLLEIVERVKTKSVRRHIHIAIALTKQADRLEWFTEKATELGVRNITLLITQHTGRHKVNVERLNKIAIAALKQSGNVYLPVISEPTPFKTFIHEPLSSLKLVCTATDDHDIKSVVGQHMDVIALVGPEGDFTNEELKLAIDNGYQPVSLGPNRLRTETAAMAVACALAMM